MKTTTQKTPQKCHCGCTGLTKGGRFLPGHDAKLKKALIEDALGGSRRAATRLENLGWTKFLEAKIEKDAAAKSAEAPVPQDPAEKAPRPRGRRPKQAEEAAPTAQEAVESPGAETPAGEAAN